MNCNFLCGNIFIHLFNYCNEFFSGLKKNIKYGANNTYWSKKIHQWNITYKYILFSGIWRYTKCPQCPYCSYYPRQDSDIQIAFWLPPAILLIIHLASKPSPGLSVLGVEIPPPLSSRTSNLLCHLCYTSQVTRTLTL